MTNYRKIKASLFLTALTLSLPAPVLAGPPSAEFEKGRSAANAGDFGRALKIWTGLAEAGDPQAEYSLGRLYANGDGVARDLAAARQWFKRAAERGYPDAQNALAKTYYYGDGGPRDKEKAIEWFRRAANNGDNDAMRRLSSLGVKPESGRAEPAVKKPATGETELPIQEKSAETPFNSLGSDTFNIDQPPSSNEPAVKTDPVVKAPEEARQPSDTTALKDPAVED